jgi:hypothetical protein
MFGLMFPLLSLVTINEDFIASSTAWIGDTFTDLKLLIILAIGLPLAFWVIRRIIGLIRAH